MDAQYENLAAQYSEKAAGYYDHRRPEVLPFVPDDARSVLEVGCGAGEFGKLVKERNPRCEVWGMEPGPEAVAAAENLDHVISGVFDGDMPELQGKKFDCIVFNDVLEHIPNPEKVLRECKNFLTDGGCIVASIPNILFFYQITKILYEQDWKYEDSGIMDNTHLRFFTKKSIVRMFESCGYEITKIEGINASFGLKYQVANALLFGRLRDWRYVQFGVQARKHL